MRATRALILCACFAAASAAALCQEAAPPESAGPAIPAGASSAAPESPGAADQPALERPSIAPAPEMAAPEPSATEPPVTEPSATEPPTTEPPAAVQPNATPPAAGAPVPPPQATSPTASPPADETAAKRLDTIRYGIDTQIQALLKDLAAEKVDYLNEELLALFKASKSPGLRTSVLEFLGGREWRGAEGAAIALVEDRDLNDRALVVAALSYLAAVRSKTALGLAPALVDEGDKLLQPALVKLLGRAGGGEEAELLLRWIDDEGSTDALRQEAVRALGDIGSTAAAGRLAEIATDAGEGKALRMFACEALGKIKDPGSVPALVAAANGEDPNVRTSAVEALASFPGREAEAAIVEAMRDSYAKARIAACKAAGELKSAAALPFLRYKAANDPEKAVRQEAIRALAAIGGDSFAFLRERLKDAKEDAAIRSLCFGLLARYDAADSMAELAARLSAEALEKDKSLYKALAREVSLAEGSPKAVALARILLADKDFQIRIAALEWAKRNDPSSLASELEGLARDDPAEPIKKRAKELLAAIGGAGK